MTREEMKTIMVHKQELIKIKRNAKAIYLLSDLSEMCVYLNAKIEDNCITDDEADKLMDEISEECANITMAEIKKIREQI